MPYRAIVAESTSRMVIVCRSITLSVWWMVSVEWCQCSCTSGTVTYFVVVQLPIAVSNSSAWIIRKILIIRGQK
jgi:hypothetical protein